MKPTLVETFEEAIIVKKDLCAIEVIIDDELIKDSKDIWKRLKASISKAKEKEVINLESLNHTINSLSNELAELKQMSSETFMSSMPPKLNLLRRTSNIGSNNIQCGKFVQSSNIALNIESMGMDQSIHFIKNITQRKHAHSGTTT